MKNCSADIEKYHENEVRLPGSVRTDMRGNRDANRDRLKRGLTANNQYQPNDFVIQGSYAMKTTVQHPENDYDIDDGAAFESGKLIKENGMEMTPLEARQMVCDALIEGKGLKKNPTVLKNCVRVEYAGGHHVDIPVYRWTLDANGNLEKVEIASGSEWRESNPKEITSWFVGAEKSTKIADEEEPQLRRLVRMMKMYSRVNLGDESLSGLILTVVAAEVHSGHNSREDEAFRNLLSGVKAWFERNSEVCNPADSFEILTKDSDAEKVEKLTAQIGETLSTLGVLDKPSCSMVEARDAWDTVFKTDYFSGLEAADRAGRAPSTPSRCEPDKKAYIRGPQTSA
jgi:hypothetical protein